jgi:hypothetical protein
MPVFLRAFPLKDDSASVSKPRRPAERLREVRWQEHQTLDRLLIVADFGDGTSTRTINVVVIWIALAVSSSQSSSWEGDALELAAMPRDRLRGWALCAVTRKFRSFDVLTKAQ